MRINRFRTIILTIITIGVALILVFPLLYEVEFVRNGLSNNDQTNGFHADYLFYTSFTVYNSGSNPGAPQIGLAGGISISYVSNNTYLVKGILVNRLNDSVVFRNQISVPMNSDVARWLIPDFQLQDGAYIQLWNNTYGQVYSSGPLYGNNPFSREGIVLPEEIKAQNVPYDNKSVLPVPTLEYATVNGNMHINVATIWSGMLEPFNTIFPIVNSSTELVFSLNNTNVALNPLDWFPSYVGPQILFSAVFAVGVALFYMVTVKVSRNRRG
ncbi:MAG: hypothetical protein M1476_05010 [Candidatus Thermoplasmatota archaeon]|nr:hypothetical protein [Candidatus Thermoplasmatota archaeon]